MIEENIDARGLKCPRPIIELAKLRRRAVEPTLVEVVADDLAFESDVRAWCSATNNKLLSLDRDGQIITAKISFECVGGAQ
jgi:tRNA 2-thiouridine synthesizing protein A